MVELPRERPRPIIHKILLEQSFSAAAPGKAGTNLHGSTCKPFPPRAGMTSLVLDHSIQVRQACLLLLSRLFLAMDRSSGHLRASKPPSFRRHASIRGVVLCRLFLAMDRSRGPLRSPIPGGMPSNPQGRYQFAWVDLPRESPARLFTKSLNRAAPATPGEAGANLHGSSCPAKGPTDYSQNPP